MKKLLAALGQAARWMVHARAAIVYNVSVAAGVTLAGFGVGLHDVGAGLAVAGALIVALSAYVAHLRMRGRD